jgi:dipeptidyl aminopeptidase/acylaminoacyl peptidase
MSHPHPMPHSHHAHGVCRRDTWFATRAATMVATWFTVAGGAAVLGALAATPAGAQAAGSRSFVTVVVGHRDGMSSAPATPDPAPLSAEQLLSISSPVKGADDPVWQPDGSHISFLGSYGGPAGIWSVSPNGTGAPEQLVSEAPLAGLDYTAGQHPLWSPKGGYIAYVSTKGGDAPEIWLWSPKDKSEAQLTHLGGGIYSMSWAPDGAHIALSDDRYGSQDIFVVSVPGGQVLRLTGGPRYAVFPSWTPDSKSVLYDRLDSRWVDHDLLSVPADGSAQPRLVVADHNFFDYRGGGSFGYAMPSPDGKQVMFRSQRSGWINYWVVPIEGGSPRAVAAEAAEQSDGGWSPDGKWIAYVANHNGTKQLYVVSAAGGTPRALVAPAEGIVSKAAWSPDGQRLSYTFGTSTTGADLYTVDVKSGKTTQLTTSTPAGFPAGGLVVPRKITYPSADGLTISAYLYEPRGLKPGEKAPGIMWVHGGPTGQWVDSYQPQVQYLVERGYAVLMPNIRGSAGYGLAFEDANNGCWGHCDLKDVLAGVDYLKRQAYVNPEKIGITGRSYGGCLSMSAIVNAPGVFQAAIPESGYGDWEAFLQFNDEMQHDQLLAYEFGPYPDSAAVYRRNSPIHNIARVTTPTMLMQGEGATASWRPAEEPVPASIDFARALDQHYKLFRLKSYPGETYYIEGHDNIALKMADMLAFFDQYLKDGMRTAPSAASAPMAAAVQ